MFRIDSLREKEDPPRMEEQILDSIYTRIQFVSEMTYDVSSGTLNPSIPYHRRKTTACSMVIKLGEGRF